MKKKDLLEEANAHFWMEADSQTVKDALKERIPDMAAYERKNEKLVKELEFLISAKEKQKKNDLLLEVVKRFEEELLKNTERPIAMLKQLLGSNQAFALNKNLKNLTREEIVEIIKDQNLIELLNKLNEE